MSDQKTGIQATLTADRDALLAVLAPLSDADWRRSTSCEGWTVKDVVAHIGNGETGNLAIARRILNDEAGAVPGFDLNRYNIRQVEKRRDWSTSDLLNDLKDARAATLTLLSELSDAQLAKQGQRATGEDTTVEGVLLQIARHDREHTEHIRAALRQRAESS